MRVIRQATSLLTIVLLCAGIAHPQKRCTNLAPRSSASDPAPMQPASPQALSSKEEHVQKLLIVADNQEHVLTGAQLFSMGLLSEFFLSSTAMRPPLAHVGGRLVFGEALRFGKRQGVGTVLHLGDATNISCRNELTSVFNTLDKEAVDEKGNAIWFMALGNHDGMLAGNLAGYQPPLRYELTEDVVKAFYSEQRQGGQIYKQKAWIGACLAPNNWTYEPRTPVGPEPSLKDPSDRPSLPPECDYKPHMKLKDSSKCTRTHMLDTGILTRGDAIKLYVERLSERKGFSRISRWEEPINVKGTDVICDVEKIELKTHGYSAIASICRVTEVEGKHDYWVGPFASHIVQKLELGGATIIMLDTSDYDNPSVSQVPFKGKLTCRQKAHADYLLFGKNEGSSPASKNRNKLIIAGHHPISDFPPREKRWIAERTSRYMSAHVHTSTKLISHKLSELVELNVASTVDHPQQAVMAKITPSAAMTFRVVEAGSSETGSPGFLEKCEGQGDWKLSGKFYKGYWRGTYVNRLLESLEKAADRAPAGSTLKIPSQTNLDWSELEKVLNDINSSEGETREFWACQSFYASKANHKDRSLFEWGNLGWVRFKAMFRPGARSACNAATGEWFSF